MTPYYADESVTLYHGDSLAVLEQMADGSVDSCVTSPPYFGLRDYGVVGQYGLEASPAEYVETMRGLFAEVRRVLADDGTLWLNLGDSYSSKTKGTGGVGKSTLGTASGGNAISEAGILRSQQRQQMTSRAFHADVPEKNLLGMPWRTAFALQDDGWILRNAIVWHKPNAMPESVTDRLSTRYELAFLFSKSRSYWFDLDPIREPLDTTRVTGHTFGGAKKAGKLATGSSARRTGGTYDKAPEGGRNPGDVWSIATQPFSEAHFAVMPLVLAERCVMAGCKPGGVVLDPFSGSGTTGLAATKHGRRYVGVDLNAEYLDLSLRTRLAQSAIFDGEAAS